MLYLEPAQLVTAPAKDFNVELKIGDVINLKGYSVNLTRDPVNLHLKEVKEIAFFSS